MSHRKQVPAATIEDCVSVLLDRSADLLEAAGSLMNVEGAILFNLKAWATVRGLADRLAQDNPRAGALASYAEYATSGMMSRPVEGGAGLGALAHLDRHAAQFVLAGGSTAKAREKVVRLFGGARMSPGLPFDEWLLDEVRSCLMEPRSTLG
ncbi:MAG: hypothetical protein HY055_01165 [Magnetospirillum sp.]|nr:hypothetical protein [Magnetospirillum sp.]